MSETPTPPSAAFTTLALHFLGRFGLVLGASLGIVVVAALALGQFNGVGIANLLFWAALIVLGLAVLPAVSELGAGVSAARRSILGQDKSLPALLAKSRERRDQWLSSSVLFGAAAIVIFVLSLLIATIFAQR